jgi:DNA-binding LacI/PurR family transcriptional regulator
MAAAGLEGAEENCVPAEFTPEAGAAAMDVLLDRPVRPTAVFAANDEVAIGAMLAIRAAGLRVPEDISVIGYGNHSLGRIYHPALTTVHVPALDLGYLAMVKLKRILKRESYEMDTCLATHLIKRATTAPPGQSAGGAKAQIKA